MKKYTCLLLAVFIVANLVAQTSDVFRQPIPIEITTNTGLTILNQSTYGATIFNANKYSLGKEITIPLNANTDMAPFLGFGIDLKPTYNGDNAFWSYTLNMVGTDNKDYYFCTFQYRRSSDVTEFIQIFNTPNSGYNATKWQVLDQVPEEFSLVIQDNNLTFLQEYSVTEENQRTINQFQVGNIKGITSITLKIYNGVSIRVQDPAIIVPLEYANNLKKQPIIKGKGEYSASGSGFIISSDGVIVTNYHVINEANDIDVVINGNGKIQTLKAKVIISDKTNDLSLIKIDDPQFSKLPPPPYAVKLGIQDVGTSVFALGYPMSNILGEEIKVTDGIINSKTGYQGDIVTYQISAPIQAGNSGGPLFDKQGNLIGITNAGVPDAQNVGYAIKTSYLRNLLDVAPIPISLPTHNTISELSFTEKIKKLSPYVVLIKIY